MKSCRDLLDASDSTDFSSVYSVFDLLVAALYVSANFGLLFWLMRLRKQVASGAGGKIALRSIIFPVYMHILFVLALVNVAIGVMSVFYNAKYRHADKDSPLVVKIVSSFDFAVQHFIFEGVALMLLQPGCGGFAAKRACKYSFVWSIFCFASYFTGFSRNSLVSGIGFYFWSGITFLFYLLVWVSPMSFIYRRPALHTYAQFWCLYRALFVACIIMQGSQNSSIEETGACGDVVLGYFVFTIVPPMMVYWTLLQDSRWWQGLGHERVKAISNDFDSEFIVSDSSIMYPSSPPPERSYQYEMESVEKAHVLGQKIDDMEKRKKVEFINFASLHLHPTEGDTKLLGEGTFSKVVRGSYNNQPCAVKLVRTVDLTISEINKVATEATLLGLIRGPNVVEIIGLTVLPPRIGIVLELCTYGSLSDLLRGGGPDHEGHFPLSSLPYQSRHSFRGLSISSSKASGTSNNLGQGFVPISFADRMYLALGCARGVEALHNYSKKQSFVHRDIKSFNFLVDSQLNAKLADLELSSNCFVHRHQRGEKKDNDSSNASDCNSDDGLKPVSIASSGWSKVSTIDSIFNDMEDSFDVHAMLVNWVAPEVLRGEPFTQPSDIYSLSLVLWEIITNRVPYSDTRVQSKFSLRDLIVHGHRHEIPTGFCSAAYERLVRSGWSENPEDRPTASEAVSALEEIWKDCRPDWEGNDNKKTISSFFGRMNRVLEGGSGVSGSTLRLSDLTNPSPMHFPSKEHQQAGSASNSNQLINELREEVELFHREIESLENHVYVKGDLVKKGDALRALFLQQQEAESASRQSLLSRWCKKCALCSCSCGARPRDEDWGRDIKVRDHVKTRYFHPPSKPDPDGMLPMYYLMISPSKPKAKSSQYFELMSLHSMFETNPAAWNPIRDHGEAVLLLSGKSPFVIATCSLPFERLLGFKSHELFGKCLVHLLDTNCRSNCSELDRFQQSLLELCSKVRQGETVTGKHSVLTLLDRRARLEEYSLHAFPVTESGRDRRLSMSAPHDFSMLDGVGVDVDHSSSVAEKTSRTSFGSMASENTAHSDGACSSESQSSVPKRISYFVVTVNSLARIPLEMMNSQQNSFAEVSLSASSGGSSNPRHSRGCTNSLDDTSNALSSVLQWALPSRARAHSSHTSNYSESMNERFSDTIPPHLDVDDDDQYDNYNFTEV